MVPGRPLLYLSIPGVAFILGVFWFRRRNKDRGGDTGKNPENGIKPLAIEEKEIVKECIIKQSTSLNIKNTNDKNDDIGAISLGKSAPIKIIQNGRCSPVYMTDIQIDTEILKVKILDVENKTLRSIDEDFECSIPSPIDLPDSNPNKKSRSFYSRNSSVNNDGPVIIKATNSAKVSPENSFLETKYVDECEQNNNINIVSTPKKIEHLESENDEDNNNKNDIQCENKETKRKVETASPSLSLCSVQSADSGKGSSLPRSEETVSKITYEFFFPTCLIGQLYGRKRSYFNKLKAKSSVNIYLKKHPFINKINICIIEGTENDVNAALVAIRARFPLKTFPNLSLQRIHLAKPQTIVPLTSAHSIGLRLNLVEGINNDIIVSTVISGGHLFVQQPLHPSYPSLSILQKCLQDNYTYSETPLLPELTENGICICSVNGNWYRAQIMQKDPEDKNRCLVKFLDFGGYMMATLDDLRQIRSDYMTMPFQATECMLSNIEPIDSMWSIQAAEALHQLTRGIVLQAQVAGYSSDNVPEIYLYASIGPNNVIFINKELVARGLAKWVETQD